MPTAYIKKLAKQGKGTIQALEKKWDKAKKLAADQGHSGEYDYIVGIFQKMVRASLYARALSRVVLSTPRFNIWFGVRTWDDAIWVANALGFKGRLDFKKDWTVVREEPGLEIGYDLSRKRFAYQGQPKLAVALLKKIFPVAKVSVSRNGDISVKNLRILSRVCETAAPRNNIWFGLRNQTDVIRMAKAFGFKGTINFNADWTVVRKEGDVEIGYDPEEGFAFYGDKNVVADLLKRMFPSARIKVAGTDVYVKGIKWY